MKRQLMKQAEWMHFTFAGTGCDLLGGDVYAEVVGETVCLNIDLSKNIRTRNKQENSYIDAAALAKTPTSLEALEISNPKLIEKLTAHCKAHQRPLGSLAIRFGDDAMHRYVVAGSLGPVGIRLRITAMC